MEIGEAYKEGTEHCYRERGGGKIFSYLEVLLMLFKRKENEILEKVDNFVLFCQLIRYYLLSF
jgi:hypothetical protein